MSPNTDSPPPDERPATPDVELFVALLGRHQPKVHRFILGLVPHPADADDILQETSLFLWREFHRFVPGTDFVAWGCAVAYHEVLAWRKRRQRDRLVFSDAFLAAVKDELTAAEDRLDERSAALAGCVQKLPPHHRELLRLRYSDGGSVDAIAARLGRTTEAVYRMLSRVRRALYECVGRSVAREVTT